MSETQRSVHQWISETFPGTDPDSPRKSIRMLEEAIELCLASGATHRQVMDAVTKSLVDDGATATLMDGLADRPGQLQPDKIAAEAADVLIVLYGVAGMRGFDLHAEVDRKMAVNRARKWAARGDGTGYHVKEATS